MIRDINRDVYPYEPGKYGIPSRDFALQGERRITMGSGEKALIRVSLDEILVYSLRADRLGMRAWLRHNGALRYSITTEVNGERIPDFRGGAFLRMVVPILDKNGPITQIEATLPASSRSYQEFDSNVRQGDEFAAALNKTRLGRVMEDVGFKSRHSADVEIYGEHSEGGRRVEARFGRIPVIPTP